MAKNDKKRTRPAREMMDRFWRKSRIAARILIRSDSGTVSSRDIRLAKLFSEDPGVTNRLIDQAMASFEAEQKLKLNRNAA